MISSFDMEVLFRLSADCEVKRVLWNWAPVSCMLQRPASFKVCYLPQKLRRPSSLPTTLFKPINVRQSTCKMSECLLTNTRYDGGTLPLVL